MIDWDCLRYVLAIARHGGLSGAARALGVNHATVSRQLTRSEETLGQKLFERLHSGLVATEAGKVAVIHAEEIENVMNRLDLELVAAGGMEGEIAVTIPPLMVTREMAQDFSDFILENPRINLKILGDNRVLNLHRREADIAFRVSKAPADSLWGRKITDQRSGYFASDQLISVLSCDVSKPVPIVAFTAWNGVIPDDFTSQFDQHTVVATCDDMVAAIALVQTGIGTTRMPYFLGRETEGLQLLPGQDLQSYPPLWLLTHPDLRHTPRIARFMSFMGERISKRCEVYFGP